MQTPPPPNSGTADEINRQRDIVARRGLTGAANDTKWSLLLNEMRTREGWKPSYRFGTIEGSLSSWDVEWWHHLPFPMISVEWFEIAMVQEISRGRLVDPETVDHRSWIIPLLDTAKFDYEVNGEIVRIFAYLPRNREKGN